MKFLTFLGKMIVLIPSTTAAIVSFIIMNLKISESVGPRSIDVLEQRFFSIAGALFVGAVVACLIVASIISLSDSQTLEYHTIYQNDQDIEVYVVTYQDEKIFTDSQLTSKIVSTSGTLHLKKDGASIRQSIDKIIYLGPNQKGSIVDKIEYSETIFNEKLFRLRLLNNLKSTRLKIHLIAPKSEEALQQTEESLRSFLYGTKGENKSC